MVSKEPRVTSCFFTMSVVSINPLISASRAFNLQNEQSIHKRFSNDKRIAISHLSTYILDSSQRSSHLPFSWSILDRCSGVGSPS